MAFSASGIPHDGMGNRLSVNMGREESLTAVGSESGTKEKRWSSQSSGGGYYIDPAVRRSSMMKDPIKLDDDEERLDTDLAIARRNSRDHAILQRAS